MAQPHPITQHGTIPSPNTLTHHSTIPSPDIRPPTTKSLRERVEAYEFHPEVYVYPTPRMHRPMPGFSLTDAAFTDDVGLYIHIPFCKQICSFCGYLKTIDSGDLRSTYVDAVTREIDLYTEILSGRTIRTLHFGGGTPSLLAPTQLERMIRAALKVNPRLLETAQEVSIEATPESVEEGKFHWFKEVGINRVSMGVQSFNSAEITLSKRHNLPDVSARAIEKLRGVGISNIVIDLMIGIEGQTIEGFTNSVKEAIKLRPETVELYALGLMPQTGLGKRLPSTLMTDEEKYRCYSIGRDLFLSAGYAQDCHNRYAIPGRGSFLQEDHVFQGMSLIGLGAGTRTYAANVHYRNTYDSANGKQAILDYIDRINSGGHAVESGIFLSPDEKIRQYAIGHIEQLDKDDFRSRFQTTFGERFGELYPEMIGIGLASDDGKVIRLTPKGLTFRDLIAKQCFSEDATRIEEQYRPRKNT